jgi:hypothetical protein
LRVTCGRLGIAHAGGSLVVDLPLQAALGRFDPTADGAMQLVPALLTQHRRPVLVHQLVRDHAQLVAGHDVVRDDEHGLGVGVVEALGLAAALGAHGHVADQRLPVGADVIGGRDHDAAQAVGQHAHAAHQLVHSLAHRRVCGRIDRRPQAADGLGQLLGHAAAVLRGGRLLYTGSIPRRADGSQVRASGPGRCVHPLSCGGFFVQDSSGLLLAGARRISGIHLLQDLRQPLALGIYSQTPGHAAGR